MLYKQLEGRAREIERREREREKRERHVYMETLISDRTRNILLDVAVIV